MLLVLPIELIPSNSCIWLLVKALFPPRLLFICNYFKAYAIWFWVEVAWEYELLVLLGHWDCCCCWDSYNFAKILPLPLCSLKLPGVSMPLRLSGMFWRRWCGNSPMMNSSILMIMSIFFDMSSSFYAKCLFFFSSSYIWSIVTCLGVCDEIARYPFFNPAKE